ncbi:hypothetical protein A3I80_01250 [Candidatus Gottesmanbacteria bacterium RIFCSPLOWO2_02_FULL_40_10]|nr:MAG: hypothetical protein A3I80_01250 [Candidatus Gottesmanbacteria bacterium RIFCSPLOWO2_02_FULL_40_10]
MLNKLLIISPYPSADSAYDNPFSALASFGKNTLEAIRKKSPKTKMVVLADKYAGGKNYYGKNYEVLRVWQRNNISLYYHLFKKILYYRDYRVILIEVEWNLFGKNPLILSLLPVFTLFLKLLRKKIILVIHGISLDFTEISPQLGMRRDNWLTKIYSLGLKEFYRLLILSSAKVIVLEKYFADMINIYFQTDKAVYIPHGVDIDLPVIDKNKARRKLNLAVKDFIILNFGFINWYKGSDIIVKLFRQIKPGNIPKQSKLIMAGGKSGIHGQDRYYKHYFRYILKMIKPQERIIITGFLNEKLLPYYFSAADLVILPYRVFISSSGPLSLAYSFKKPFIVAEPLSRYFHSPDFKKAAESAGLKKEHLVFRFKADDLSDKIKKSVNNLSKMKNLSSKLRSERSWLNVSFKYLEILNSI